jgi:hypothetical protein
VRAAIGWLAVCLKCLFSGRTLRRLQPPGRMSTLSAPSTHPSSSRTSWFSTGREMSWSGEHIPGAIGPGMCAEPRHALLDARRPGRRRRPGQGLLAVRRENRRYSSIFSWSLFGRVCCLICGGLGPYIFVRNNLWGLSKNSIISYLSVSLVLNSAGGKGV